jgi:hypothetical protein
MKMFGELRLVRALTDEQIAAMPDLRLVGTVNCRPSRIRWRRAVSRRPPGRHHRGAEVGRKALSRPRPVICATPRGTPLDLQLEDLDRFAKEVIPTFRDTRTAAAAQ